jgi:NUMOD3 motif
MKKFYVYEWFIVDTLKVFYVGKGQGKRRFHTKRRNQFFTRILNKYNCDVRLVKSSLTEQEAFELEQDRIAELRAIGQAFCNFANGGEGNTMFGENNPIYGKYGKDHPSYGFKWSDEQKQKLKGLNKGEKNPYYGKSGIEHPTSRIISVDGNVLGNFREIVEWAKQFPKPNGKHVLRKCLSTNQLFHGHKLEYL